MKNTGDLPSLRRSSGKVREIRHSPDSTSNLKGKAMKLRKKGNVNDKTHQVKGNLEATMAKKVMKSGSDIQATVEDVNVTDAGNYDHLKSADKK